MKHGCDEPDKELGASYFFLGDQLSSLPFEPFKTMGKTLKSSVPVLSAGRLYFLLSWLLWVFRISGQLLWSSVAPMQLGAWRIAALYFASRSQIRVVFRFARVVKTLGF